MDIRADIYDSAHRYRQTERFPAATLDEAKTTAHRLAQAVGHSYALVYVCDGQGGATIAAEVEVDR
ncbi:hypothetical protein [Micromonospora chersina]|uniref:hypothetical protein n=1 Tax=Micromonospora chersina TaxID=47854 RepID=UPI003717B844